MCLQDYELQLITYKAQLEPVASPAKKPKVQSGSESVIQEVGWRWAKPPLSDLMGARGHWLTYSFPLVCGSAHALQ